MLPFLTPDYETDHPLGNPVHFRQVSLVISASLIQGDDAGDVCFRELGGAVLAAVVRIVRRRAFQDAKGMLQIVGS